MSHHNMRVMSISLFASFSCLSWFQRSFPMDLSHIHTQLSWDIYCTHFSPLYYFCAIFFLSLFSDAFRVSLFFSLRFSILSFSFPLYLHLSQTHSPSCCLLHTSEKVFLFDIVAVGGVLVLFSFIFFLILSLFFFFLGKKTLSSYFIFCCCHPVHACSL